MVLNVVAYLNGCKIVGIEVTNVFSENYINASHNFSQAVTLYFKNAKEKDGKSSIIQLSQDGKTEKVIYAD